MARYLSQDWSSFLLSRSSPIQIRIGFRDPAYAVFRFCKGHTQNARRILMAPISLTTVTKQNLR
jgi:hypothetical protein